jgi:hypothetical protein
VSQGSSTTHVAKSRTRVPQTLEFALFLALFEAIKRERCTLTHMANHVAAQVVETSLKGEIWRRAERESIEA